METQQMMMSSDLLPVGFRFMPTDKELVIHYLMNKVCYRPVPVADAIEEIDATQFYRSHPKNLVTFPNGEREWFFFIHEDDDHNCSGAHGQRRRDVGNGVGFWKPIGPETPIYDEDGHVFAFKVILTYYSKRCHDSKPNKTHWKMVEYHSLMRREWVLGRILRGVDYTC